MTIKELYDWAVKNGVEDFELLPSEEDNYYSFSKEMLHIEDNEILIG